MKVLAHRGLWIDEKEKNTLEAIKRAFSEGFGVETDIRDCEGKVVISHNPPIGMEPSIEEVFFVQEEFQKGDKDIDLALNIKADGLYILIDKCLKNKLSYKHFYFFDMSAPEQYAYLKKGYPIYTRSSEYEKEPLFIDKAEGIWLDQFTECDHIEEVLPQFIKMQKRVTIISPEIHGRNHIKLWHFLKPYKDHELIALCTDKPREARDYFG